ncbi:hypothetical protein [uncultured Arcticibacterium sp.]|uniref:hypothetical protein n=1 Tax=uncultured Arcticibacterium sp. TaxID=2173042 RepID=UPI0030FCD6F2
MKKILEYFNLLSLNVVLGAVLSSYMFWQLPDGSGTPDIPSLILLGLTTWIIYILDRLLDIKVYPENPSTRHKFHAEHQYNLSVLLVVLSIIAAVLCFFIPRTVFYYGCVLSVGLVMYFFVLNKFLKNTKMQWLKEPTTAICYCLAVIGIAYVQHSSINLSGWFLAFMFFIIASQNLLVFSYFESFSKKASDNTVDFFGQKTTVRIIRILGFIVLFLAIFFFSNGWDYIHKAGLLLAIMSQILSFMPAKQAFFLQQDRYRWVGDGVFILPIVMLLF